MHDSVPAGEDDTVVLNILDELAILHLGPPVVLQDHENKSVEESRRRGGHGVALLSSGVDWEVIPLISAAEMMSGRFNVHGGVTLSLSLQRGMREAGPERRVAEILVGADERQYAGRTAR